jgi:hypothetical protein
MAKPSGLRASDLRRMILTKLEDTLFLQVHMLHVVDRKP